MLTTQSRLMMVRARQDGRGVIYSRQFMTTHPRLLLPLRQKCVPLQGMWSERIQEAGPEGEQRNQDHNHTRKNRRSVNESVIFQDDRSTENTVPNERHTITKKAMAKKGATSAPNQFRPQKTVGPSVRGFMLCIATPLPISPSRIPPHPDQHPPKSHPTVAPAKEAMDSTA